jgi:pimeloyl-ACP methyl ester carboxylesterase
MRKTRSADGTIIAYDYEGSGPSLVLVVGAFCDRQTTIGLSSILSDHFTVFTYDRRGRGDSGDTLPYAVDREIEDLAAVIQAAPDVVRIYGHSSGAILALEAASRGVPITALVVYEPPFTIRDDEESNAEKLLTEVTRCLEGDQREEAVESFLIGTGVPSEIVELSRSGPNFESMVALAHTLPYDLAVVGDGRAPTRRLERISIPTLIVDGGNSAPWAAHASLAVTAAVQTAKRVTLEGQIHPVAHEAIAPVIIESLGQG